MLKFLSSFLLFFALGLGTAVSAQASIDVFEFDSEAERLRYQAMIDELRCPKCQNQNLSGSNSPIAEDLRKETYRLIDEGASDEEILDFMVARYGDYVRYRPEVNSSTYALWFGPLALLLIALLVVGRLVWVKRKASTNVASVSVTAESEPAQGSVAQDENGTVERAAEKETSSSLSEAEQARLAKLLSGQDLSSSDNKPESNKE